MGTKTPSGVRGSDVTTENGSEMEAFPTVYVRTLFTGRQMREEEELCTYGLFDEVVGEATDSSTNVAAVVVLKRGENVYCGEKDFKEFCASCDDPSSKLKFACEIWAIWWYHWLERCSWNYWASPACKCRYKCSGWNAEAVRNYRPWRVQWLG